MSDTGDVFYNGITVDADGDATIDGDLTVKGTTTTVESTSVLIDDKLLELAHGTTGTPSGDAGIIVERGSSTNSALIWDESEDAWVVCTTSATGASTGDLTITPSLLAAGSIGIGTTAPSSNLEIEGSSGDLAIEIDNNASGGANLKIVSGAGNSRADFVLDGNNHLTMKGQRVAIVGTNPQHTLDVTGDGKISTDLTVGGDIIIDDGGSLKEAGGTAAFTFDGSGNVTKIGQDSPSSGQFLKWDGSKAVWDATSGSIAADDISTGDAAVTIATTSGNITIDAQEGDADIIFKGTDNAADVTALTLDMSEAGAAIFNAGVTVGTDLTVTDDIILDDGGSLKEAGGTAAITFDGSGNVTKIGQDSMSSGDVLTWDGAKFVGEAPTTGDITGVTAGDGISGGGTSGTVSVALDLNELSAAAVSVANDSIAIIDADDSNGSKKESIADLVTAIAGTAASTGLSASSGVLTVSDLHSVGVSGANNQLITDDGDGTVTSESGLTYDGSTLAVTGDVTVSGGDVSYGNGQDATLSVDNTSAGTDGRDLTISAGSAPTGSANQNGGDLLLKAGGGDGTGTSVMTFSTKVNGTDAAEERMRLHTNGYLGIGTNAPSQLIHASGADPIFVIQNSDNEHGDGQANSKILFGDHAGNALAMLEGAHSGSNDDSKGKFTISTDNGSGSQLAMSIDDAQITTFSANVVVGGTTPKLTIGDGGAEDTMLVFDGHSGGADFRIGIDDGTDTLEIGKGTAHGTTPVIKIDSNTNCQVLHNSAVADGEYSGDLALFTAGEDLTAGEVCYFKSDGKMWKAVATAEATARCVAMATASISADAVGAFLLKGFARFNSEFPTWTVGGALYTPEAETSGKNVPEQTQPDTDGDFVQVIGFAVGADAIYFDPDSTIVEVA